MKLNLLILSCLWGVPAFAGTLTGLVDKTVGTVDDTFVYTLTVQGDFDDDPLFPKIKGMQIQKAGTSSQTQIINFKISKQVTYNYVLTPTQPGEYVIPAIKLEVDDELQQTPPIKIVVSKSTPEQALSEAPPFFVTRELSATSVYEGEQIIAKSSIYSRVGFANAQLLKQDQPDFLLFSSEDQKKSQKMYKGQPYQVIELTQVFIPKKAGKLVLNPFGVRAELVLASKRQRGRGSVRDMFNDPFFGGGRRVAKSARSETQQVTVKPVPKSGKLPGFHGVVGDFQLSANLSSSNVEVGETVTLTITVRGRGSLETMKDFKVDFGRFIKIYPDQPINESGVDTTNGLLSRRMYKFALVPTKPGEYQLSQIEMPVFIPKLGSYLMLKSELPTLVVSGEAEVVDPRLAGSDAAPKRDVQVLAEDIFGIHRGAALNSQHTIRGKDYWVLGLASGVPSLGFILLMLWGSWRGNGTQDPRVIQRQKALQKYQRASKKIALSDAAPVELLKLFKVFVGDRIGIKGEALTAEELLKAINLSTASDALKEDFKRIMDDYLKREYGGGQMDPAGFEAVQSNFDALAREVAK